MIKKINLLLLYFLVINSSFGQVGTSSPYSRFGLGDLQSVINPEYLSLGGGVTGFSDPYYINPYNPATYTSFGVNSFLLSTGGMHTTTNFQNNLDQDITHNTSFSHVTLGFPINHKIGVSIGLLPYSNMGYELDAYDNEFDANFMYSGDGGISKAYIGGAYEISDQLSVGANASYLFGGLNKRKRIIFNDPDFLNTRSNSSINLKGYYYEFGFLFKQNLEEDKSFNFGLTTNNNSELRSKRTDLVETFEFSGNLYELVKDTAVYTIEWGEVVLPQHINAGVSYIKDRKWLLVANYSLQNWSQYKLFNESDNLNNSIKLSTGMQYIPEYNSITKYYKRIIYRLGVSYAETPLEINGNQLNEMILSIGFGLPVKKSRTRYDLSLLFGQRGTIEDNLLQETYIRFGLSVSYDGIWFVKRKYD